MNENDIDQFVKQLKHSDPDVRFDAVKALETAGGDDVLPHVISALQDKNTSVAFLAEQVLIRMGGTQAKEALANYHKKRTSTKLPTGKIRQPVVVALSGVTFEGRARALSQALSGDIVELVRRRDNIYDRNAIECLRQNGDSLGWLPKEIACEYAPHMDQGCYLYGCILSIVSGHGIKPIMGARVTIGWSEADISVQPLVSQKDTQHRSKDSWDPYRDEDDRDDEINRLQDMRDDSGYDDHNYDRDD